MRKYNLYERPKLPRSKYGIEGQTTSSTLGSNSLFADSDFAQSVDIESGNSYIPDFIGATDEDDGVRGLVPAPEAGENHYHFLSGDGTWKYDPANAWLKEWPFDELTPTGLGIQGDFHVTDTLSTMNLNVEGRAHFWELVIDKVKATGGSIIVSPSSFNLDRVGRYIQYSTSMEPFTSLYLYRPDIQRCLVGNNVTSLNCVRIYMRSDDTEKRINGTIDVGDMVRCRTFNIKAGVYQNVSNKDYWTFVVGTGEESYEDVKTGTVFPAIYADLAYYFITANGDKIPVGSVFSESSYVKSYNVVEDTYLIAQLKNKAQQTLSGGNNSEEEYPLWENVEEFAYWVLLTRGTVEIPKDILEGQYVGLNPNPVTNPQPISGQPTYQHESYHIEKYSEDPYLTWNFGYGVMDVSPDDEMCCLGSLHDMDRRNAIVIASTVSMDSELKPPSIAQYWGIDIFGVSISRFRISALSYNRNIFVGDFEVIDTDGTFTNIFTITANQTQSAISNAETGLMSYITQRDNEISTYVIDSYSYCLSYTSQTATQISSTVTSLSNEMSSNITQLSDRIDLAVTKGDMEMVGIHLDGENSTVNLVGSLAVKQNGDGDIDTIQVYDEDEALRVQITPEGIPAKSEISNISTNQYYWSGYNSYSQSVSSSTYVSYEDKGIFTSYRFRWYLNNYPFTINIQSGCGEYQQGDILSFKNITFKVTNFKTRFNTRYYPDASNISIQIGQLRYQLLNSNNVSVSGGQMTILTRSISNDRTLITITPDSLTGIEIPATGSYSFRIYCDFTVSAEYRSKDYLDVSRYWVVSGNGQSSATIEYTLQQGETVGTNMNIGTNGFYYSAGIGKYLYSGQNEFEIRNGENILTIDNDGVKIMNKVNTSTNSNVNAPMESVIYMKKDSSSSSSTQYHLTLPTPANYGIGRIMTVIGYLGLQIKYSGRIFFLGLGSVLGSDFYIDNGTIIMAQSNVIHVDTNEAEVTCFGNMQLIALEDGWHILNTYNIN